MAHLDPQEAHDYFQSRVVESIKTHFPLQGRNHSLHVESVETKDELHPDDLHAQHDAKINGKTWATPIYAHMAVKDNVTGAVLDKARVRICDIPKMTARHSYLVNGQEYQLDNQWQLKPGVYVRRNRNNELEAQFNVVGRSGFDVVFDPAKKIFQMEYNKAAIPLYPLLKATGVSDATLEKSWGKEVLEANQNARNVGTALERFYKTSTGKAPTSKEEAVSHLLKTFELSKMRPEATALTLGKPIDTVTGEALHLATEKMLKVHSGHPEDDRDSIIFKDLRSGGDYAVDRIKASMPTIRMKIQRKLNSSKAPNVRDVFKHDYINQPVHDIFRTSLARVASQINPLEMTASALQTTILGPGGIQSEQSVTDEAKLINASHFGFLDPINTPEGDKTGITLRLPIGVKKVGTEPKIRLFNLKSGQMELVSPFAAIESKVVLPDQVKWVDGKPQALHAEVKMMGKGNEPIEGKFGEAQYVLLHASQLFNPTSNLIPFMGSTSGGRAGMATRHMEQAISLVNREAPLVQVGTGSSAPGAHTFEQLIGQRASHQSPVTGTVTSVEPGAIHVKGQDGKKHVVQLYQNYPLNDAKSVMHSTPVVQAGDSVTKGQTVADTNYARNGTLALGTNLRVAYIPFKGYNFEDGVIVSRSAAEKLSSMHLHKTALKIEDTMSFKPKDFVVLHPGMFRRDQLEKLDDKGIVHVGQKVHPGDPLILATKPFELKDRTGVNAIRRSLSGQHTDRSLRWESDFEGEVVGVHHTGDKIAVHVRTLEPMQIGDKISNRYGGKGIVSKILEDHEMPHTKDGKHVEVALNPIGVAARMNLGSILEVAGAKIAQKTGKTYVVQNFQPGVDYLEKMRAELKAHGLSDTEELFDPGTKKSLGKALVGPKHMIKLVHQVEKKEAARGGMTLPGLPQTEGYDLNLQPMSGGHSGGQSAGSLGMYALLAHGAKANIREMQTWKSEGVDPQIDGEKKWKSQHAAVWAAIQTGTPLPTPQPTFAFKKFTDMLKGAGINVEKKGHNLAVSPMTDKHILQMAGGEHGELKRPHLAVVEKKVRGTEEPTPETGGIFDTKVTGGHGGNKWSFIRLAEPLPNPLFEGPIRHLTGLKDKDYEALVHGTAAIDHKGTFVEPGKGLTGGAAIKQLLDKIDVKKDLVRLRGELDQAPSSKVDPLMKKVKYLQALDKMDLKPSDAYVLNYLPVLPPVSRPLTVLPTTGDVKFEDINGLYKEFGAVNERLKTSVSKGFMTDEKRKELRSDYYDGVKAIIGHGVPYADAKYKGLLHIIGGKSPKDGYFQNVLTQRRQDMTMRSTIVPEPALGLDEVGLPKHGALKTFSAFVVRELVLAGAAKREDLAQEMIAKTLQGKDNPQVWRALEAAMERRPVLLKRDPALHQYSFQAFKARPVSGNAIKIHPLVCGGFNADFDGDTMAAFVPISHEAVEEAKKMMPSNNLFMESTGKIAYSPTMEAALGIYKLSVTGKNTDHKFANTTDAIESIKGGKVHYTDVVHIAGKPSTPGRALLASALPLAMQAKMLHGIDTPVDKKGLDKLLTELGKNHPRDFGVAVNRLKDLGNDTSSGLVRAPNSGTPLQMGVHSLGLSDIRTDHETRDRIVGETKAKLEKALAPAGLTKLERDKITVDGWLAASDKMKKEHEAKLEKDPTNLFQMYQAGVKPSWTQYRQMALAPMLYTDSQNQVIPSPVLRSYAEGLDVGGYWTGLYGARRGAVLKVQEVREPGYMSKLLMNTAMHVVVDQHDCGTDKGISMHVSDKDAHDRHLAADFKAGPTLFKAGQMLSPDVLDKMRSADKNGQIIVRSPLKCESEKGICQKCMGLSSSGHHHDVGRNVGVLAAHAIGERAVQLTMKEFHTGGTAGGASKTVGAFKRFQDLTRLPETTANQATVSMASGKIEKIEHDQTGAKIWVNGHEHHVAKDSQGMALYEPVPQHIASKDYRTWAPPRVGDHVDAGQSLSDPNRTFVNPHDLYAATKSMEKVQNHLASEIFHLYKDEGVKRVAVETMVRAMGGVTKIKDPGDHPTAIRGDVMSLATVNQMNKQLHADSYSLIHHTPILRGIDMLPLEAQEDWMAKLQHNRLHQTLAEAAATGAVSNTHSTHPIPAIVHGSEFGLNSKDSLKPQYGHLKNVPGHAY